MPDLPTTSAVGLLFCGLGRVELEAAGLCCRFGREAPNDLAIFLGMLEDAE